MSGRPADAPAGTGLRDELARVLYENDRSMPGSVATRLADALLPLVRGQVEAARQDALNEAQAAIDDFATRHHDRMAHTPELRDPLRNVLRDRAARGETRQP